MFRISDIYLFLGAQLPTSSTTPNAQISNILCNVFWDSFILFFGIFIVSSDSTAAPGNPTKNVYHNSKS